MNYGVREYIKRLKFVSVHEFIFFPAEIQTWLNARNPI